MKRRIIAASLAVIMMTGMYACNKNPGNATPSDAPATATDAVKATVTDAPTSQPSTTAAETTTEAPTTEEPTTVITTVATTVKKVVTTVKKVTTTKKKPQTTKAPKTTEEKKLYEYRTQEETYDVKLKYGVVIRRVAVVYYEKLPDGTEKRAKEEIVTEYYDKNFYSASYSDLLPAAKENRETYRKKIKEVLKIINGYRAAGGLKPLTLNEDLTILANVRAEEIAWSGDHDHTRPNHLSCFSLMRDHGFDKGLAGENIGWGFETASSVCEAWKNSETHYENIMNPKFKETGIGIAADPKPRGKLCWAQYFYG